MSGFLLDTNVLSELVKPRPEGRVARWVEEADEERLYLSVLTLGEIRRGVMALPAGARRGRLEAWLERDLRGRFEGRILGIDVEIAERWGVVSALAASAGRPAPVVDGLMAATALHHNLTLVTRNTADVEATGVRLLNPWVA